MTSALERPPDPDESVFLRLVAESCERRCEEISARAEAEARQIVKRARREALERVRSAVRTQRERRRLALEAANAELATEVRLVEQQVRRRWLDCAWPRLLGILDAEWKQFEQRQRWMREIVQGALEYLETKEAWRVEHPAGLEPAELEALTHSIAERTSAAPELVPARTIRAGLRIHAGGATVDGTLDGLLADRDSIEGRLLAELLSGGAE